MKNLILLSFVIFAVSCSLDPVHDEAQADLGDEAPGVDPGPTHRPGQPCLLCHDGTSAPKWSVAGTIYGVLGSSSPLQNAKVALTDANGSVYTATSNEVGNFWVDDSHWSPTYPVHVAVSLGNVTSTMTTIIGRDGSCAGCHADPASRISVGRVYLAPSAALLPNGGGG